jgi:hypothetical protein
VTEPRQPYEENKRESGTSVPALPGALTKLMSLHDGDQGVLDTVAHGPAALPALRRLLLRREPSGLYQPRCRVVEAIALLGGHGILIDFLRCAREVADPVEAAGEEAVMNAAARALSEVWDEQVFQLLLSLAESRRLPGPIEVLGAWKRPEALSCLVEALADDLARPVAEEAIRGFRALAIPSLLHAAGEPARIAGAETESSRRRRRAALNLLLDLSAPVAADLRTELIRDDDAGLSVLGCRFALACGAEGERYIAASRLIDWLERAPQFLRGDIKDCLMAHADIAGPIAEQRLAATPPPADEWSPAADTHRTLTRVAMSRKRTQRFIR